MKAKQLIILTGVAAALGGLAVWSSRNEMKQTTATGIGEKVLPRLKDQVNDIASLSIQSPSSTVTVSRVDGIWRIPAKWNYPADFGKIRGVLNKLADCKILQPIRTTAASRAALQLLTASDAGSTNRDQCATRIQLQGPDNRPLAVLHLGKTRSRPGRGEDMGMGGYPDSQYVMPEGGQACLIGDILQEFTEPGQNWLDMEFITLNDILAIQITGGTNGNVRLERANPTDEFKLTGPIPDGKTAESTKISQAGSILNYLRFDDVADPKLSPATTGLDKPVSYQARNQKGEIVTFRIGACPASDETKRYASVSVSFEAPALPPVTGTNQEAVVKARAEQNAQTAATVKTLNEKFSPWIYLINKANADTMASGLNELIKNKGTSP